MNFNKLDSRNIKQNGIKLSSLQAEDMEKYGLTKQDLVKLCWKELNKKLKIEEYDYRKNKNIYNSLRVVARDITLLVRDNAKAIVFKGATYNPTRQKVNLAFNNISELPAIIQKNIVIDEGDNEAPIIDLIFAIETFTAIRTDKKLRLPDYLTEFYTDRYQNHVLSINILDTPEEKTKAILSITHFESNQGYQKPTEGQIGLTLADDLPYVDKDPVEPLQEPQEQEPQEVKKESIQEKPIQEPDELVDVLDIPVFASREKTVNRLQKLSSILRTEGED
ncbi:hypothetical protein [Vreelandella neptunia]|uniref:Uncharacterized protein n=1 Tax=Vreelandella neptunia TaxID=115551 RepID=A0ABS9SAJ5_9GAMM|nr:hypothetical protein [Halomonas neptunia]MCH4813141.1 hypothetical protein [Halomonas neptunia]